MGAVSPMLPQAAAAAPGAGCAGRVRGSSIDSTPVSAQKPTLKKRMRSTVVTKSSPSARCAAFANAVRSGGAAVAVVVQLGGGAHGSLDEPCSLKQVVNFEMAASAT